MQRKSFQSTEDTPKSFWSCGFKVNKKEATELWNAAKDHYNECKARDSKLGKFKTIHSYKENEDDTISFSAKKNCKTAKESQIVQSGLSMVIRSHWKTLGFGQEALAA